MTTAFQLASHGQASVEAEPSSLNKERNSARYKMGKINLSMTAVRQILMNSQRRKSNSNSPNKVLFLCAITLYL